MKGKKTEENKKDLKIVFAFLIILVVIVIMVICFLNNQEKTTSKNTSIYTKNQTTTNTDTNINTTNNNNIRNDTRSTSHYCDASGCTKKGTYSIDGTSGKEYYCYEHYKQMEQWVEMIMGY